VSRADSKRRCTAAPSAACLDPALRRCRGPFDGLVVVVGSAPVSHQPAGLDACFRLIALNAAQRVAATWGVYKLNIIAMMFSKLCSANTNDVDVRVHGMRHRRWKSLPR